MHSEYFVITDEACKVINDTKKRGNKVFAVGTTSCRVLETATDENGIIHSMAKETDIFIYPGYKFKMVDKLLTNFHLPESTLIMLVSALASKEMILNAYKEAVDKKYRFFSFGDCMLIL
jgi:S-adenosylmethionine:tRNA ribosyltransferase-isomerase